MVGVDDVVGDGVGLYVWYQEVCGDDCGDGEGQCILFQVYGFFDVVCWVIVVVVFGVFGFVDLCQGVFDV